MTIPVTHYLPELEYTSTTGYHSAMPNITAALAIKLMDHFSIIAAEPDGEDSAGRARLKLLTPEHVVERACTIAELMVKEVDRRGWFVDVPPPTKRPERPTRMPPPSGSTAT